MVPIIIGLVLLFAVVVSFRHLNPTAMIVLSEDVEYVTADSNCWTCNEHIVVPRDNPQDKSLTIIEIT